MMHLSDTSPDYFGILMAKGGNSTLSELPADGEHSVS